MLKIWNPAIIGFLIVLFAVNWNSISWIFNNKVLSQALSGSFKEISLAKADRTINRPESIQTIEGELSERQDGLEIPKIGISVPLVFVSTAEEVYGALDRGVVHFPASVLPDHIGQTIILGHSAPNGWPKIKYDWVFNEISKLENNDEIFVYFNNKKYTYKVKEKFILEKGQDVPEIKTDSQNIIFLITCWPMGKDYKRIAAMAVSD